MRASREHERTLTAYDLVATGPLDVHLLGVRTDHIRDHHPGEFVNFDDLCDDDNPVAIYHHGDPPPLMVQLMFDGEDNGPLDAHPWGYPMWYFYAGYHS